MALRETSLSKRELVWVQGFRTHEASIFGDIAALRGGLWSSKYVFFFFFFSVDCMYVCNQLASVCAFVALLSVRGDLTSQRHAAGLYPQHPHIMPLRPL